MENEIIAWWWKEKTNTGFEIQNGAAVFSATTGTVGHSRCTTFGDVSSFGSLTSGLRLHTTLFQLGNLNWEIVMLHSSFSRLHSARYAACVPACLAVAIACGQSTTSGPEGSTSGTGSSSATSTSNASSTATSSNGTNTASTTGASGAASSSTGASGQSGTSSGPSGQSGTSSGASGQSGTSSGGSGTSSGGSGASTSAAASSTSGGSGSSAGTNSSVSGSSGGESTSGAVGGEFTLTSSAHEDGAEFADAYTCEGKSFFDMVIPPLAWANPPNGTMSYALTFVDTFILQDDTIDDMLGYHWAMIDIPADVTSIVEGMEAAVQGARRIGGQQGAFFGPCPDGREDTYAFEIHAIPTATLTFQGNSVAQAVAAIEAASIGSAVLTGTSSASPQ